MTFQLSGSARAASLFCATTTSHQVPLVLSRRHLQFVRITASIPIITSQCRTYAAPPSPNGSKDSRELVKAPCTNVDDAPHGDGINPPRSTLPPPLNLPSKTRDMSTPVYYWKIGRAYGKFYYTGVKQTWSNIKVARVLRRQIRAANSEHRPNQPRRLIPPMLLTQLEDCAVRGELTRSQFQLLMRDKEDRSKLPLFAIMVAAFGEWLPLIVPFIPGRVPRTCRIPKQIQGMRKAIEERRKESFRRGIEAPSPIAVASIEDRIQRAQKAGQQFDDFMEEAAAKAEKRGEEEEAEEAKVNQQGLQLEEEELSDMAALRDRPASWLAFALMSLMDNRQLIHVSSSLGLHGRIWDRLGLTTGDRPFVWPSTKLKLVSRLSYLNIDDSLLLEDRMKTYHMLSKDEVEIACEERGIDVVGRKEEELRKDLGRWLEMRVKDEGHGQEIMNLLFKRPNAW